MLAHNCSCGHGNHFIEYGMKIVMSRILGSLNDLIGTEDVSDLGVLVSTVCFYVWCDVNNSHTVSLKV